VYSERGGAAYNLNSYLTSNSLDVAIGRIYVFDFTYPIE